jgi:EAL and modified HD-GYP domain-containing signal transduction protein
VSLSQKLLKFASAQGENHQVTSIHDVVLRFGLNRLQSWTSLLMLSGAKDKPSELFRTALIRAKFCELVGGRVNDFSKDSYFTVGLFSCLDAVMDLSLDDLLKELNFEDSIKKALLEEHGSLGVALSAVKAIEQGQTDFELPKNLTPSELSRLYLMAMEFSHSIDLDG